MSAKLRHLEPLLRLVFEPNDVINSMPDFVITEEGNDIRRQDVLSREKRVGLFLKHLRKAQVERSAVMTEFLDVLKTKENYQWLLPLLTDCPCENFVKALQSVEKIEQIKKLIRVIYPAFQDVQVNVILPHLCQYLSQDDMDEVEKITSNKNNGYGFYVLIHKLITKEPSWVQSFIKAVEPFNTANSMFEGKYSTLAEALKSFFDYYPNHLDPNENPSTSAGVETTEDSYTEDGEQENEDCQMDQKVSSFENEGCTDSTETDIDSPKDTLCEQDKSTEKVQPSGSQQPMNTIPPCEKVEWQLRNYQKELCIQANSGENVILCAPTNSGKTLVAGSIIEKHLHPHEKHRDNHVKKVVFFAPTGGLADQQSKKLEKYLPEIKKAFIRGNTMNENLSVDIRSIVYSHDLIVMTPQILLNALEKKSVDSIFDFTLLIFDECHHTHKSHPYNQIMVKYLEERDLTKRTQIIGMTATLGVGKAKDLQEAENHIIKLCGSLDATGGVITVRKPDNVDELNDNCPDAAEITYAIEHDEENPFKLQIKHTMSGIADILEKSGVFREFPNISKPIYDVWEDTSESEKWCAKLINSTGHYSKQDGDSTLGRDARSCGDALKTLIDASDICKNCRPVDAVDILQNFIEKSYKEGEEKNTEIETQLYQIMQDSVSKLEVLCKEPKCQNINLVKIKQLILDKLAEDPDSRAMIMVPKRKYTSYLKAWMQDDDQLKDLQPEVFTGVGKKSDSTGMPHKEQAQVLKKFNEESTRALICTPEAAGEGMDIQECNLVINYDYMRNEISMVQTKGRARKEDSTVVQLSSGKVVEKDKLNTKKIHLMNKATRKVQKMHLRENRTFKIKIKNSQSKTILDMKSAETKRSNKRVYDTRQIYDIYCRKCEKFTCTSSDIVLLNGNQHTVQLPIIKGKYEEKPHPNKGSPCGSNALKKVSRISCIKCKQDWGNTIAWKHFLIPVLKITGFKIWDKRTRKFSLTRKWILAPFKPKKAQLVDEICIKLAFLTAPSQLNI